MLGAKLLQGPDPETAKAMVDWKARIVADPAVQGAKPLVRGTRLSVDFLLSLPAEGWSEAQILENYPELEPDDLRAVFAYARTCLADEAEAASRKLG